MPYFPKIDLTTFTEEDRGRIKRMVEDPEVIERLWLVRNGVPYDRAFELTAVERAGMIGAMNTAIRMAPNVGTLGASKPSRRHRLGTSPAGV